jgi:hypothetical protein
MQTYRLVVVALAFFSSGCASQMDKSEKSSGEKRFVAVVFAVVVEVSNDDESANMQLEDVARSANEAIERALSNRTDAIYFPGASSFVWMEHPDANIFRCERCDKFFSANNSGVLVHGLPEGTKHPNSQRCLECFGGLSETKVQE